MAVGFEVLLGDWVQNLRRLRYVKMRENPNFWKKPHKNVRKKKLISPR
jgi:hypothetical protein